MRGDPKPGRASSRAFLYRAGVRIAGTVVACDAAIGTDLVFLSHAPAVGAKARAALPRLGAGVRVLCSEVTLALLGPAGERLRRHALLPGFGRPFALGGVRLELFPSDHQPGAASLLCERAGRRIVYTGPLGPLGRGGASARVAGEVRAADALCVDARGVLPGDEPPPEADALEAVGREVRGALGDGATPVLRLDPLRTAMAVGLALAADRIPLRAHREIAQVAGAFRAAHLPAPRLERFAGKAGPGEVVLWPLGEPSPPRRSGTRPHRLVLVAGDRPGHAGPAESSEIFVRYPTGPSVAALRRYVEATGARELAVLNPPDEPFLEPFRAGGITVYPLGPPRQIGLFSGPAGAWPMAAL